MTDQHCTQQTENNSMTNSCQACDNVTPLHHHSAIVTQQPGRRVSLRNQAANARKLFEAILQGETIEKRNDDGSYREYHGADLSEVVAFPELFRIIERRVMY